MNPASHDAPRSPWSHGEEPLMKDFEGKVAVVTGGAGGIGKALVKACVASA